MAVQIKVPTFLQHLAEGRETAVVCGKTVGECLRHFVDRYPLTGTLLFDNSKSQLLGHVEIYVNGISTFPEELSTPVHDDDSISMLYLMVGG